MDCRGASLEWVGGEGRRVPRPLRARESALEDRDLMCRNINTGDECDMNVSFRQVSINYILQIFKDTKMTQVALFQKLISTCKSPFSNDCSPRHR